MTVATVQVFFAILAVIAQAAIVILLVLRLAATGSSTARDWYDGIARAIAPSALVMAWVVAVLATTGSLYFSEVAHFEPCRLCWYQRIAMYPLVVILGIGAAWRDAAAARYARAVAAIGALIAAYHVALEWVPALDSGACSVGTPCTLIWFREFGYISLPTLALTAFLLIITLLSVRPSEAPDEDAGSEFATGTVRRLP
jgi:disulfide bond formation protein DsbB